MDNIKAKVINRHMLTEYVMKFTIETYQTIKVIPGQWALFLFEDELGPFERSYFVADQYTDNEKTILVFVIQLSPQGRGSAIIRKSTIGTEIWIKGIFGNFVLQKTSLPKVFIGFDIGIVPLLNMAKYCFTKKTLFFSVSYKKHLFYEDNIKNILGLEYYFIISQEKVPGYDSKIDIISHHFDLNTEFYLCGKLKNIEDIFSKLTVLGYKRIYRETF